MESNSIDSIVTDPPYELGFMGKAWDRTGISYNVDMWREVFRVLKPGGYLLSFGGTRTYHRMACAIEDAGFEIRDMVEWMYGSGFPKSLNIGKAIDKLQGNKRRISSHYIAPDGQWRDCNNHKPNEEIRNPETHYGYKTSGFRPIDKGNSTWEGWGTALKPAHEPICMARKPLSEKTVAENVLKWGTGGINVDGCRVGTNDELTHGGPLRTNSGDTRSGKALGMFQGGTPNTYKQSPQGRWPANLIHNGSQEVLGLFPVTASGAMKRTVGPYDGESNVSFLRGRSGPDNQHGDSGSAARFFYCAKASKAERDAGCENLEERFVRRDDGQPFGMNTNQYRPDGSERKSIPPRHNNHPTVKPLALMRYLCRLVTPPGGIILDPFMGSGSTGVAAELEGFRFIGIDQDKEAFDIACRRVSYVR